MKKLFYSFVFSSLFIPNLANADVSLKLEPGLAVPSTDPQSERFYLGAAFKAQPLVGLTPWFDIGPSVSLLALPSDRSGIPAGTVVALGGGARVKRPHDESNHGQGWSAMSPWVDADVQYVRTGELDRPGFAAAAGASVPTSDKRNLWIGPFVRYQGVFQEDHGAKFDTRNAKIFIFGVSLELSPSVEKPLIDGDADNDGTPDSKDRCPYVWGPKDNFGCPKEKEPEKTAPPPEEEKPKEEPIKFEISQKVQFLWDSAVLEKNQLAGLDMVVSALLKNVDYNAKVEGHASSEGKVEHNQKLSEKRAQSVVDYLVAHGVDKNRLTAVGFGSSIPVADNATKEGREANRRVEFVVSFVLTKGSK